MRSTLFALALIAGFAPAGSAQALALGIEITGILISRDMTDPLNIEDADITVRAEFPHNATWQAFSGNGLFTTIATVENAITIANAANAGFNGTFIITEQLGLFPDFTPGGSPAPDTFFSALGPDFTLNGSVFRLELDNLPDPNQGDPLAAAFLMSYTEASLREIVSGDPGGNFYDFGEFEISVFEIDGAPKVPLPAGLTLLATGLAVLASRRRGASWRAKG
ncbi:MAG: hypothetical protein AAF416_14200 [Pseudomonadota bacterium]